MAIYERTPNRVLRARNLSAPAKTLYAMLLSYSWQADKCFPGYARLCEDMGIGSRRILRKYIQELEQAKLLAHIRRGQGLTNIYILLSLNNARLETAPQADGHRGDHQKEHRGDHLNGHRGEHKEDEDEEDTGKEDEDSSKKALKKDEVSQTCASGHKEQGATRHQQQNRDHRRSSLPPPIQKHTPSSHHKSESTSHTTPGVSDEHPPTREHDRRPEPHAKKAEQEVRPSVFVGKPLTQDEIDARRRKGKNASGYTPLSGTIAASHWQELKGKANSPSHGNGHGTHYNKCTKNAPLFIDAIIEQFATLLGDEPENIPQNINRAAKLYRAAGSTEEDFRVVLHEALDQAKRYHASNIQKQREDGQPNRMPIFFTILEERLEK